MMERLTNIKLLIALLLSFVAYLPLDWWLERQNLFELIDAVLLASMAGIVTGYAIECYLALKLPVRKLFAAQVMIVGLTTGCLAGMITWGGMWYWRAHDKLPGWAIDGSVFAFSRWVTAMGLLLVLTSTRPENKMVPAYAYRRAGAIVVAVIVATALITIFKSG